MGTNFENKGAMTATIVVAAANSLNRAAANYVCDGVNDEVEIQQALDALPATGGEVVLLDGTFNVEVQINLDSYQTLRGMGWNTILTTSTADLTFLSAVGGAGTEKVGICIRDMRIAGDEVSSIGVHFVYVNHSIIEHVISIGHANVGIQINYSKFNQILGNICEENGEFGIYINNSSDNNVVSHNICRYNGVAGMAVDASSFNVIADNTFEGNYRNGMNIFTYADYNAVLGNTVVNNSETGIYLVDNADGNAISGNACQGNDVAGIVLEGCYKNTISGNTCCGNGSAIVLVVGADKNDVSGNAITANVVGIFLVGSSNNNVSGNIVTGNGMAGILVVEGSDENIIENNHCTQNSQNGAGAASDIELGDDADRNIIQGNTCRAGGLANVPDFGININSADCDGNIVIDNDLYNDGFVTASFNDAGTGTKLNVYVVPFGDGTDPQDSGFLIDAAAEMARSWLRLPAKVHQVVRMKVYARSVPAEADHMRLELVINGGADNEPFNTHVGSVADHPSTSVNFAANDVIYWTVITAGVLALLGGDSVEVKVLHEIAGGADIATNAYFRTVEIEYV
jgi:parallel beta-helix repeat protein